MSYLFKKLILPFILIAFIVPISSAQDISISTGVVMHEGIPLKCLEVKLDPEPKTLKKAWKDYLKSNHDIRLKGIGFLVNKDLLSAEGVMLMSISSDPLNLYTLIVEDRNGSHMKLFLSPQQQSQKFFRQGSSEFMASRNILERFLKDYLPRYYTGRIEDTEKRVASLAKEINKLNKEITRNSESIEKLQREIEEKSLALSENQAKLELASSKLETRRDKLIRIKSQLDRY